VHVLKVAQAVRANRITALIIELEADELFVRGRGLRLQQQGDRDAWIIDHDDSLPISMGDGWG
jgi:hypothetical protein